MWDAGILWRPSCDGGEIGAKPEGARRTDVGERVFPPGVPFPCVLVDSSGMELGVMTGDVGVDTGMTSGTFCLLNHCARAAGVVSWS